MKQNPIKRLLASDSIGGILLLVGTILALLANNSEWSKHYNDFLNTSVSFAWNNFQISKPLLLWINDGLMSLFFLMIGLELKRELMEGQLSDFNQVILPIAAAVGGMLVPAIVFFMFAYEHPDIHQGWAIPMATDIAFALGVMSLLGKRIPSSLKLFLMTLAIIDDLGAILVIAFFYTNALSYSALGCAAMALVIMVGMNLMGIKNLSPYGLVGIILWVCVLKSGLHPTLAGVAMAFTIPLHGNQQVKSPLKWLEHSLYHWVTFLILPLFAFANAGVSFVGISFIQILLQPLTLAIATGLVMGKTLGVLGITFGMVKLKIVKLPKGVLWSQVLGVSVLCGIGFTMSLFVGSLAFPSGHVHSGLDRVGILLGSSLAAILGYGILYTVSRGLKFKADNDTH